MRTLPRCIPYTSIERAEAELAGYRRPDLRAVSSNIVALVTTARQTIELGLKCITAGGRVMPKARIMFWISFPNSSEPERHTSEFHTPICNVMYYNQNFLAHELFQMQS